MTVPSDHARLETALRAAVRDAWVEDRPTTGLSLARATGTTRPSGFHPNARIQKLLALHVEAGIATAVCADTGTGYVCWNWTGRPVERQTLGDALRPYLDDTSIRAGNRQLVKESLRAVLASTYGDAILHTRTDAALLAAATQVTGTELTTLGTRAAALDHPKKREFARSIRGLLRWAFDRNLVVVHTREPIALTSWTLWIDQYVPAIRAGGAASGTRKLRSGMHAWRSACERTMASVPATLGELTAAQAQQVLSAVELLDPRGAQHRYDLAVTLRNLGYRGLGPWQALASYRGMVKVSDRHWAPWFLLNYRTPRDRTLGRVSFGEQVLEILREHAMPESWIHFLTWFDEWASSDLFTLRVKWGATYQRKASRKLKRATLEHRYRAVRTLIGTAHHVMGWAASECTPFAIFGPRFPEIFLAFQQGLATLVANRAALLADGIEPPGTDLGLDSPMIMKTLIQGGMLAEALAEWAKWSAARGNPVATEGETLQCSATYRYAMDEVLTIPASTRNNRVRKDLSTILHDVPSIVLLPKALESVRKSIERAPRERKTALAVQRYLIGYFVATGMVRAGELGMFQFQKHYAELRHNTYPGGLLRRFRLAHHERKGQEGKATDHEYPLLEEFVPQWLWEWHRETGRALLMEPWVVAGNAPHDFVFTSQTSGGPMASPEVLWSGQATSKVRNYFRTWRLESLLEQGHPITANTYGQHGPHANRAQMQDLMTLAEIPDEHQKIVLGHKGNSTLSTHYRQHEAATVARILRKVIAVMPTSAALSSAPVADQRRRASASSPGDTALAEAVRRELFSDLENLSPREAYARMQAMASQYTERI